MLGGCSEAQGGTLGGGLCRDRTGLNPCGPLPAQEILDSTHGTYAYTSPRLKTINFIKSQEINLLLS